QATDSRFACPRALSIRLGSSHLAHSLSFICPPRPLPPPLAAQTGRTAHTSDSCTRSADSSVSTWLCLPSPSGAVPAQPLVVLPPPPQPLFPGRVEHTVGRRPHEERRNLRVGVAGEPAADAGHEVLLVAVPPRVVDEAVDVGHDGRDGQR